MPLQLQAYVAMLLLLLFVILICVHIFSLKLHQMRTFLLVPCKFYLRFEKDGVRFTKSRRFISPVISAMCVCVCRTTLTCCFCPDDAGRQASRDGLGTDTGHHRGTSGSRVLSAVAEGPGEIWKDVQDIGQLMDQFVSLFGTKVPSVCSVL